MNKMGQVKLTDVGIYPNLVPALGCVVGCTILERFNQDPLYYVKAEALHNLGCNVGADTLDFPFYSSEVEVMNES